MRTLAVMYSTLLTPHGLCYLYLHSDDVHPSVGVRFRPSRRNLYSSDCQSGTTRAPLLSTSPHSSSFPSDVQVRARTFTDVLPVRLLMSTVHTCNLSLGHVDGYTSVWTACLLILEHRVAYAVHGTQTQVQFAMLFELSNILLPSTVRPALFVAYGMIIQVL